MRVLGVDPGLTRCGAGTVDALAGRRVRLVDVTVIRTAPDQDLALRLASVHEGLVALIALHRPDVVAVERVFAQQNTRTAMGTAQASAIALLAATQAGIPVVLHTPSEVKASVTGSGRADKPQVTQMVTRLLRLTDAPKPADAADALALAICQIWRGGAHNRLQAAIHSAQLRTAGTTRAAR